MHVFKILALGDSICRVLGGSEGLGGSICFVLRGSEALGSSFVRVLRVGEALGESGVRGEGAYSQCQNTRPVGCNGAKAKA